jgi:hypothetical protein
MRGTNAGRMLIGLGLSRENINRLTAGQPIIVRGETLGVPHMDITIMFGETEALLAQEIKTAGLIGPDTIIHTEGMKQ